MKRSLLLFKSAFSILFLCSGFYLNGQEAVFSEDFSGFTTGTHSTPATNDISGALDSRTHATGWTGSKIYSAGGEIKLGTSEVPGWIETPVINMSGHGGDLFVRFDISRWPEDATAVRIYLNGLLLGNEITPVNEFQTIKIPITSGTVSGKIKFESSAKRFFLDNIVIGTSTPTLVRFQDPATQLLKIFPNPAGEFIKITRTGEFTRLEISDISGRVCKVIELTEESEVEISLDGFSSGTYIMRFIMPGKICTSRFIIQKNMY